MITRCRVRVTLTNVHVDEHGFPNREAEMAVWVAAAGLPDRAELVLDLGPARHVNGRLISVCASELGPKSVLTFEGSTPTIVQRYLDAAAEVAQ